MGESPGAQRFIWRSAFVGVVTLIAFAQLLPLGSGSGGLPGPDLLTLFAVAWVLRRPDFVPVTLIALLMLMADFLFMRPPGLWAAIVVVGTEFLRRREQGLRDLPFLAEWGLVAGVLLGMTLGEALLLLLFAVQQPSLGLTLIQLILTILAYPIVVGVTAFAFGLRKAAPGEVDELGRRL